MNRYVVTLVLLVAFCLSAGLSSLPAAEKKAVNQKAASAPADAATNDTGEQPKKDPKKEEKRRAVMAMKDRTLEQLYKTNPDAKTEIKSATGYAVFDATGINVVLFVGVKGKGIAVDNASGKATYMTMMKAGTGPGVGYKDYRMVLVFKNKTVFDQFTTIGMDAGASADAVVKMGDKEAGAAEAVSFNPYIKVYQITDKGLLLQANWGGTTFLKDSELNE